MLTFFLTVFICFVLSSEGFCQAPDTLWARRYGDIYNDSGASVRQTSDGGFIIAGYTSELVTGSRPLYYDVWLLKTDDLGDVMWDNTFGGAGNDYGHSVQETSDGGFIVAGDTGSFGAGGWDAYLVKTDSTGNLQWESTFGGTSNEHAYDVAQTSDGGYILIGTCPCPIDVWTDIYLVKVTGTGDLEWETSFCAYFTTTARSVLQTSDGGYIFPGVKYGEVGAHWCWLVKTNSSGDLEWSRELGGALGYDMPTSIGHTGDGGYIIAGYGVDPSWEYAAWLMKTNESGYMEWYRYYGGDGYDRANSARSTFDGGYIFTGYTDSYGAGGNDLYIVKTDGMGIQEWESVYGGTQADIGRSVQLTDSGGYVVTGHTGSFGTAGLEVWLLEIEAPAGITETVDTLFEPCITGVDPNPFTSCLSITYNLPEPSQVVLSAYDLSGRLVEDLMRGSISAGEHALLWDPDPALPDGCYLIILDACGDRAVRRCVKLD